MTVNRHEDRAQHGLEQLVESLTSSEPSGRPIIRPYDADTVWLWQQWSGTVLELTSTKMIASAAIAAANCAVVREATSVLRPGVPLFAAPVPTDPIVARLASLGTVWEYQLTLSTFVVTFFLNQAWSFRASIYTTVRSIQGCAQDVCLLLSAHAARETRGGTYTPAAQALLDDVGRYVRLTHLLYWSARGASQQTYVVQQTPRERATDQVARLGPLLSPHGLDALVATGELSEAERAALGASGLPPGEYAYVLLEWVALAVVDAREAGVLRGGAGCEQQLLARIGAMRGGLMTIGDSLDFRMSMTYVQFVQILVDTLVIVAPIALYPKVGVYSVPLAALITYFYEGLLELSKSFFDIFGREGYSEQTINVEVLIKEVNLASERWKRAGAITPTMSNVGASVKSEDV
jgi:hypothetical protein